MIPDLRELVRNESLTFPDLVAALEAGESPDIVVDEEDGQTLLMYLCEKWPNPRVVKTCLDYGANVNAQDSNGLSVLTRFLEADWVRSTVFSKHAELQLTLEDGRERDTAQLFQLLLDAGADVNLRDKQGETALYACAATHKAGFFVKELLARGADPDIIDDEEYSALTIATAMPGNPFYFYSSNETVVNLLVEHTSRETPVPKDERTPLIAALEGANFPAVRILMKARYSVEIPERFRYLEPVAAVVADDWNRLDKTLRDADSYKATASERAEPLFTEAIAGRPTPLMWAAALGRINMMRILIEAGVDVNEKGIYGWTPLFYAVWQNQVESMEFLRKNGADINHEAWIGEDYRSEIHSPRNQDGRRLSNLLRLAVLLNAQDVEHKSNREVYQALRKTNIRHDVTLSEIEQAGLSKRIIA